jgi:hypothetical protein
MVLNRPPEAAPVCPIFGALFQTARAIRHALSRSTVDTVGKIAMLPSAQEEGLAGGRGAVRALGSLDRPCLSRGREGKGIVGHEGHILGQQSTVVCAGTRVKEKEVTARST